jgi:hypothetical protein
MLSLLFFSFIHICAPVLSSDHGVGGSVVVIHRCSMLHCSPYNSAQCIQSPREGTRYAYSLLLPAKVPPEEAGNMFTHYCTGLDGELLTPFLASIKKTPIHSFSLSLSSAYCVGRASVEAPIAYVGRLYPYFLVTCCVSPCGEGLSWAHFGCG